MTRSGSTIRAVCWDWNGTLLDDVERCMRIMNDTLAAFDRAPLASTSHYRSIFRFPLSDFYADAGIPSDLYRDAVDHYLDALARDATAVPLHDGARETIDALRVHGVQQVLASATLAPLLGTQLAAHDLAGEFDRVLPITDPHNASKHAVIAAWLDASGYAPGEVLMIGDTAHDREFAADLGARFVHFTQGAPGGGRRRGHRHP